MVEQAVRVGIVGAGNNTRQRHIPGLQAIEGVEVVRVCNRSRESSQRAADQFGIPNIDTSWGDLVTASDIDAVVIGTWPYLHREVTCAALAAGKHVMCEARMAMNAAEAHAMRAASQERPDLVAQVVPSPFTLRVDRTIQELLADGYLGELYALVVRAAGTEFADVKPPAHWRQQRKFSGNNILSMGIWYEATMRWVGHASSVLARTRLCVGKRPDPETGALVDVDVPDHVDIVTDLPGGAQGSYQFSGVTGLGPSPGAWLFGSAGTLHFDPSSGRLLGGRPGDDSLHEIEIPDAKAGGWRVEEEFVNAIRGHEPITHTTFEDGVRYMEFTDAVHRSSESGQAVALPLTDVG